MPRKKQLECALENDAFCQYVIEAWRNRHKNDIIGYLRGAVNVLPDSQTSDELKFLIEVAKYDSNVVVLDTEEV